jgi:hypothetical protein
MPDPIGGAYRDASSYWNDQALDYCENAHTVTSGALCDESTVISDACRAPANRLDAFVCDDKQMSDLQTSVWGNVKNLLSTILGVVAGRP